MSGTKCPVSGTNQLVPDKMSGTLGYLFSGLLESQIYLLNLKTSFDIFSTKQFSLPHRQFGGQNPNNTPLPPLIDKLWG